MASHPDFLCVGAQKTATSWLHSTLARMPGIFLPVVKESHYFRESSATPSAFANRLRRERAHGLKKELHTARGMTHLGAQVEAQLNHYCAESVDEDWYRGVFSFANTGDLRGEVCPSYFGLPEDDIARVNAINPDVRIVLIVRDPVDRCWSHIRMHRKQEGDRFDFVRALRDPDGLKIFLDYTIYDRAVPRWREGVGDRLRLFLYDDIVAQPQRVLDEMLGHIGYPRKNRAEGVMDAINVGESIPLPRAYREKLYGALQSQYFFLESLFPDHVARWRERHERELASAA